MFERRVARRILIHYGFVNKNPRPTDLERIVSVQKITLKDLDPEHPASGWFRMIDGTPTILINRNRKKTHQRFTLAHELGHYFLNHNNQPPDTAEQLRTGEENEISANRFAAEFLMPKDDVEILLKQGKTQSEMEEIFNVSTESMGYRLDNLGYEYDHEFVF